MSVLVEGRRSMASAAGPHATNAPEYSIVVPVYNEEAVLPALAARLTAILGRLDGPAEVILVDDGSHDESYSRMLELNARDPRFKVIQLSRNFGHQMAITAGLDFASGRAVVVMDADLQDPPETILTMVERWRAGFDVVYGVRRERAGEGWFKRATASAFYRLLRRLSDMDIPADVGDFRLIDRRALNAYMAMRESDRYVRGMFSWVGFRQVGVPYDREKRVGGSSHFPLRTMLRFAVDGIVSFSSAPLRLALGLGLFVSAVSFVYGFVAILLKATGAFTVPGWTSLVFVTSFIGGMQLMMLGVIGEYVGRTYVESKGRPLYIVSGAAGLHEQADMPRRSYYAPDVPERRPAR
jgi:glycosyltransferase involved in cell wall biosynthesis